MMLVVGDSRLLGYFQKLKYHSGWPAWMLTVGGISDGLMAADTPLDTTDAFQGSNAFSRVLRASCWNS